MNFNNWSNHLDIIKRFYNSELYNEYVKNEEVIELFYGYITAIGEDIVGQAVSDIYYGENSNFWVDYLIEDYIKYHEAIVPNIIEKSSIQEIEATLDYQRGIPLNTKEELFNFIVLGKLLNKQSKTIPDGYAIRRNIN